MKMRWLEKTAEILLATTCDMRELAKISGCNPKTFYLGTKLDGVNICGQDLRDMDFTDLAQAEIFFDVETRLDRRYMLEVNRNPRAIRVLKSGETSEKNSKALVQRVDKKIRELIEVPRVLDRVALLLLSVVRDPTAAPMLLENYPFDASTTMDAAIESMRRNLLKRSPPPKDIGLAVAMTVEEILKWTYLYNRSNLLITLVTHLGKVSIVRDVLLRKVRNSHASQIQHNRAELLSLLGARDHHGLI
jgi:hypothetical protein